ncbi:MAG: hypothetical protein N2450_06475, partial [bacterium]|nr:hypothetical protein [bacterium]
MQRYPLLFKRGLIFIEVSNHLWILDTGAPNSFGDISQIELDHQLFSIQKSFIGISRAFLSPNFGSDFIGLIGNDVINQFDFIFNLKHGELIVSNEELKCDGQEVPFTQLLGSPIVNITIQTQTYSMILDTGAEISYLHHNWISQFRPMGRFDDYNPILGKFSSETYQVEMNLGGVKFSVRCGIFPEESSHLLSMFGVDGILGNPILHDRV